MTCLHRSGGFQPDRGHPVALFPENRINRSVSPLGFVLGHRLRQYGTVELVLRLGCLKAGSLHARWLVASCERQRPRPSRGSASCDDSMIARKRQDTAASPLHNEIDSNKVTLHEVVSGVLVDEIDL